MVNNKLLLSVVWATRRLFSLSKIHYCEFFFNIASFANIGQQYWRYIIFYITYYVPNKSFSYHFAKCTHLFHLFLFNELFNIDIYKNEYKLTRVIHNKLNMTEIIYQISNKRHRENISDNNENKVKKQ